MFIPLSTTCFAVSILSQFVPSAVKTFGGHSLMHIWSLSLILTTLICCFTDCARSKSCRYHFQCELGIEICCAATKTCTRRSDCPRRCLNDSDCSLGGNVVMYQSIPSTIIPPRATPGHLTSVQLHIVGHLT